MTADLYVHRPQAKRCKDAIMFKWKCYFKWNKDDISNMIAPTAIFNKTFAKK